MKGSGVVPKTKTSGKQIPDQLQGPGCKDAFKAPNSSCFLASFHSSSKSTIGYERSNGHPLTGEVGWGTLIDSLTKLSNAES